MRYTRGGGTVAERSFASWPFFLRTHHTAPVTTSMKKTKAPMMPPTIALVERRDSSPSSGSAPGPATSPIGDKSVLVEEAPGKTDSSEMVVSAAVTVVMAPDQSVGSAKMVLGRSLSDSDPQAIPVRLPLIVSDWQKPRCSSEQHIVREPLSSQSPSEKPWTPIQAVGKASRQVEPRSQQPR